MSTTNRNNRIILITHTYKGTFSCRLRYSCACLCVCVWQTIERRFNNFGWFENAYLLVGNMHTMIISPVVLVRSRPRTCCTPPTCALKTRRKLSNQIRFCSEHAVRTRGTDLYLFIGFNASPIVVQNHCIFQVISFWNIFIKRVRRSKHLTWL